MGIEGGESALATVLADVLRDTGVTCRRRPSFNRCASAGICGTSSSVMGAANTALSRPTPSCWPPRYGVCRSVEPVNQAASDELRAIEYADVAVVTLGYPADQARHLRGSGFLVPPVEGLTVKGVTHSSSKWDWVARAARTSADDGLAVLRASIGRAGDPPLDQSSDQELARIAADDIAVMVGLPRRPAFVSVTRWHQGRRSTPLGIGTVASGNGWVKIHRDRRWSRLRRSRSAGVSVRRKPR